MNLFFSNPVCCQLPIERFRDIYHLIVTILEQFPHVVIIFIAGSAAWVITVALISCVLLSAALTEQQQG